MSSVGVLPSLLAVAAFLPPCFYLWSVTSFDRRPEPAAVVVGSFVLGALGAALLNSIIAPVAEIAFAARGALAASCLRTILLVAAPEEVTKFLVLVAFARRFIDRHNPMSGLVYGAAVGLGFAAAENVGYLLVHADRWTTVAFVRSVVTVPVHGVLGIIAGVYVARARVAGDAPGRRGRSRRALSYAAALLLPILLHVLYNLPFALTRACEDPAGEAVTVLKAIGLTIGLAIAAAGASITFRLAGSQDPAFEPHCLSPYLFRTPWRVFVLGSLCGLLGSLVMAAEILTLSLAFAPSLNHALMITLGIAFIAGAAVLHRLAKRQQDRGTRLQR